MIKSFIDKYAIAVQKIIQKDAEGALDIGMPNVETVVDDYRFVFQKTDEGYWQLVRAKLIPKNLLN